ncbi:MAG: DNA polymerase III subunit delta [Phycisphaerae bacterium]
MSAAKRSSPPVVVIYGDEAYQKSRTLQQVLASLLPPHVDRALALCEYDCTRTEEQGGPSLAAVMDDLNTLPFLADRRVVLLRDAEKFVSAHREKLERYLESPAPTATLVLECRSFPKTTRLYKSTAARGGQIHECKRLMGRALADFVVQQATECGKRLEAGVADSLVNRIGQEQGVLAGEIEKLALYVDKRSAITLADVDELVGLSREEKVFAVMDAAGQGDAARALSLWNQAVASDSAAPFKAVGGIAFVLRKWLAARRMLRDGLSIPAIAPKVMMWGRERELQTLLARLSERRLHTLLSHLAQLDAQAKIGVRSIEMGVEALLLELAA